MSEKMKEQTLRVLPFEKKPRDYSKPPTDCRHIRVLLNEETRLVECIQCGRAEDAFGYLWRLATKAEHLGTWFAEFNRINRLRAAEQRADRPDLKSQEGRWYRDRPPATAKRGREVWDRIVSETGEAPPALNKNLKSVMSREPGTKVHSDAGVSFVMREYGIERWIEKNRKPQLVSAPASPSANPAPSTQPRQG